MFDLIATWASGRVAIEEIGELVQKWRPYVIQGAKFVKSLDSVSSIAVTRSGQQLKQQMRIFVERHNRRVPVSAPANVQVPCISEHLA